MEANERKGRARKKKRKFAYSHWITSDLPGGLAWALAQRITCTCWGSIWNRNCAPNDVELPVTQSHSLRPKRSSLSDHQVITGFHTSNNPSVLKKKHQEREKRKERRKEKKRKKRRKRKRNLSASNFEFPPTRDGLQNLDPEIAYHNGWNSFDHSKTSCMFIISFLPLNLLVQMSIFCSFAITSPHVDCRICPQNPNNGCHSLGTPRISCWDSL